MRTFRFRLERVLGWYRKAADLEESRLAACLSDMAKVQEGIDRFHGERLAIERDFVSSASIPAQDAQAFGLYRLQATSQEIMLNRELEKQKSNVEAQTARMKAAQQRVRLVEKLRARQVEEHVYIAEREWESLAADAYLAKWPQDVL
jgi:flagellar export protein FliJ